MIGFLLSILVIKATMPDRSKERRDMTTSQLEQYNAELKAKREAKEREMLTWEKRSPATYKAFMENQGGIQ